MEISQLVLVYSKVQNLKLGQNPNFESIIHRNKYFHVNFDLDIFNDPFVEIY